MKRFLPCRPALSGVVAAVAFAALQPSTAFPDPVPADAAASAARAWLSQTPDPFGTGLAESEASGVDTVADDDGEPLFHAVRLEGGGTVVTSTDTGIEPIVAFGPENLDVSPGSPLHALLVGDMMARKAALEAEARERTPARATVRDARRTNAAERVVSAARGVAEDAADDPNDESGETPEEKWARLLGTGSGSRRAAAPVPSPATVKVEPLTGTKWNQGGASNAEDRVAFDLSGNHSRPFSYYTPSFYPGGCAPVALAQVLAFYNTFDMSEENRTKLWEIKENGQKEVYSLEWPKSQHRQDLPFRCVERFPEQLSPNPQTWDFEKQPNVGALIASCGALLGANYTAKETSASLADFPKVLKGVLHYNGATYLSNPTVANVVSTVKDETERGRIVCLGLSGPAIKGVNGKEKPKHVVIADGHGYSGSTTYIHLNLGWGGMGDVWYNLPRIDPPDIGSRYDAITGMVYDMRPGIDMDELGELDNSISGLTGIDDMDNSISGLTGIDDMDNICDGFPTFGFTNAGIRVEWRPYAKGKTYTISRGIRDGTYSQRQGTAIKTGVSGTEFVDRTAQRGVRYLYTIEMENPSSLAYMSPECHLTGFTHVLPPTGVTAGNWGNNSGVKLSWKAADGAGSYDVFRWGPALTEKELDAMVEKKRPIHLKSVNGGSGWLSCTDGDAAYTGDHYAYTVRSCNQYSGLSETSAVVRIQSSTAPSDGLGTPALSGSGDSQTGDVTLRWSRTGSGTSYLYANSTRKSVGDGTSATFKQKPGTTVIYRIQSSGTSGSETIYSPLSRPIVVSVRPEDPKTPDVFTVSDERSGFEHRRGKKIVVADAYYNFRYRVWRINKEHSAGRPHLVAVFEKTSWQLQGETYSHAVYDWHVKPDGSYEYYVDIEGVGQTGRDDDDDDDDDDDNGNNNGPSPSPGKTVCTVLLDRQDGSGGDWKTEATYGKAMPPIAVPKRTGHAFGGYYSGRFGNGTRYYTASGTSAHVWDKKTDATLYAKWTPCRYTVTLDQQDGSGGDWKTIATYGSAMDTIKIPTRKGHTFGGYYSGRFGNGTQYYTASGTSAHVWDRTSGATLYAKWTPSLYTVTLDRQDGSGGDWRTIATYGSDMDAIKIPTRKGHTFQGYFSAKFGKGTRYYTASGTSAHVWDRTSDTTLYAKWTPNRYAVTLDRQGGYGGTTNTEATFGAAMPPIYVPKRTGHTFGGYYSARFGNGTRYYTAAGTSAHVWDRETAPILPAGPSETGTLRDAVDVFSLEFATGGDGNWSWKPSEKSETHDGTDVARSGSITNNQVSWMQTTVTGPGTLSFWWKVSSESGFDELQFLVDGTTDEEISGTSGSWTEKTVSIPSGSHVLKWNYSKDGSVDNGFDCGWVDQVSWSPGPATLYAKWMPDRYAVTLDRQGGYGGTTSTNATYGAAMPPIYVPKRTGHVFGGYFSAKFGKGTQYYSASGTSVRTWKKTSPATLYAKWTPGRYAVTLDRQNGYGGTTGTEATYGSAMPPIYVPKRTGHAFGGYFTAPNGRGTQYYSASGKGVRSWKRGSDTTLYAKWTPCRYTVTLDRQEGTGGDWHAWAAYGSDLPAIAVPKRTGHDFGGYFSEPKGGGTQYYTVSGKSARTWNKASDATLYAKWTAKRYTVTLDRQNGYGGTASKQAVYGLAMPAIVVPKRNGHSFGGYFTGRYGGGTQYYQADGSSKRTWDKASATTLYAKWIDETGTLRDAVDEFSLSFETGGNGNWGWQTDTAHDGSDAARSGRITHNQSSWMQTTVKGPGTLAFWWKVSCEKGSSWRDYLEVLVDGKQSARIRGETDWTQVSLAITGSGDHVVKWNYRKNASVSSGSDCGWVDQVEWKPSPSPIPVYRLYSTSTKTHFYTSSETERAALKNDATWRDNWIAYLAYDVQVAGTVPLYRFYSPKYGGHLYTIGEKERASLLDNPNWNDNGIAYYVYPTQEAGTSPVDRFWSPLWKHHLFTMDETESLGLKNKTTSRNWNWQFVAFYALPKPAKTVAGPRTAARSAAFAAAAGADASGGADGAAPSAAAPAPWTLLAMPDAVPAADGDDVLGLTLETLADAPDAAELSAEPAPLDEPAPFRLTLPAGAFDALLWSAADGVLGEGADEGAFDFELPDAGVWHWLRVRDAAGDDAFSLWLRLDPAD